MFSILALTTPDLQEPLEGRTECLAKDEDLTPKDIVWQRWVANTVLKPLQGEE